MADIKKRIDDLHKDIVEKISDINKGLKAKERDVAKLHLLDDDLKELEREYAKAKCVEVFDQLKNEENPVKAAIIMHSYFTTSHSYTRTDSGAITSIKIVEDKPRQIDLVKLCKHCGLPADWQYKVEKFNQLLAMKTATDLKMSKAQIKKICDSFYMSKLAKEIDMGATPTSNTAICKQLQQIFDAVLFEVSDKTKTEAKSEAPAKDEVPVENTNAEAKSEAPAKNTKKVKNMHRVNNHDVAYLLMCYSKRGKKKLSVAVAKNSYVHRLVMDIMHRVVTGKTYDLEYRMIKKKDSAEVSAKDETPVNADVETKADTKAEVSAEEVETIVVEKTA